MTPLRQRMTEDMQIRNLMVFGSVTPTVPPTAFQSSASSVPPR